MPNLQNSQEYNAIHIPDVNQVFTSLMKNKPMVSSIIGMSGKALNHKHEWLEYKKSPTQWQTDGATVAGVTTLTFDSTEGVQVGDVLKFTASTGASISVKVKVLTVVDATDITVTRPYGGTTDMTIPDNAIVSLISRAKNENSGEGLGENVKPSRVFNFTQIFRRDLGLSRTTLQTALYGLATEADRNAKVEELVNFQVANQLADIAYEFNNSLIDGVKEERVDGAAAGSFGGILPFMEAQASSQYDASANSVSSLILNNAIDQAVGNGANGTELTVLLCHPTQARKISAFNTSGNNPVMSRTETVSGSYVVQYQSDLAGTNGGALTTIVVDRNFPQDKIAILNPESLNIAPMQNFFVQETTDLKTDGRTWKLLGELTLEFKNAADSSMLIHNLAL